MIQETMTVHKALCELKMLDKRIESSIAGAEFCRTNKHSNAVINGVPLKEYGDEIVSQYQSIVDLITRRDAIKRAVVASNAVGPEVYRSRCGGDAPSRPGLPKIATANHDVPAQAGTYGNREQKRRRALSGRG